MLQVDGDFDSIDPVVESPQLLRFFHNHLLVLLLQMPMSSGNVDLHEVFSNPAKLAPNHRPQIGPQKHTTCRYRANDESISASRRPFYPPRPLPTNPVCRLQLENNLTKNDNGIVNVVAGQDAPRLRPPASIFRKSFCKGRLGQMAKPPKNLRKPAGQLGPPFAHGAVTVELLDLEQNPATTFGV
jgi:hypothetical protein